MKERERRFTQLCRQAAQCRFCPGMAGQKAVLGPGNGPRSTPVVFVAEAPGRFGGGHTGIPFKGDRSGDNFEALLDHIRLTRNDVFITNAVLCNPLKDGNNRKPIQTEIQNCSYYLKSVLDLTQPRVVVTLGAAGLDAVNRQLGTNYKLKEVAAQPLTTPTFHLLPLYHPSPRVTNSKRPLDQQKRDFEQILPLTESLADPALTTADLHFI